MQAFHTSALEGIRVSNAFPAARPSVRERGSVLSWFLPDMAMAASLAALVYLFAMFGGMTALFRDSDAGWHIRNGETILATGALPHFDPYSFSKAGQPWVSWEWLADAVSGLIHRSFGLSGMACFYGLAIAATVWFWFRLNWAIKGNFLLACLFAAPMLSTANLHWLARPHVFGWLFLLAAIWFFESLRKEPGVLVFLAVALVSAIWANVHGSFFLAPVVALVYAFGHWLRGLLWVDATPGHARSFLLLALASAAGTLLNPYGLDLNKHVLAYLADSQLLDRIGEFQTFNFHAEGAEQIILALGLGFAGGIAALAVRKPERFLLSVLLFAMALRTARTLPIAALILLPLANGSITEVLRGANLRFRKLLLSVLDYGDALRALDRRFNGVALAPLAALLLFAVLRTPAAQAQTGFPKDQFPVAAATVLQDLPQDARIFSPDKFGGYLIYRFAGHRKVFFDGRSDFYGASFLKDYGRMVQVRPGWEQQWNSWGFTHALLPRDYSLIPALEAGGWKEIYRDGTSVLLESLRN